MNCEGCQNNFNRQEHLPHLLSKCGHSLCKKCLNKFFSQGSIVCKVCGQQNFQELPEDFPKNITLLELLEKGIVSTVVSTNQNSDSLNENQEFQRGQDIKFDSNTLISRKSHNSKFVQKFEDLQHYCQFHDKNYEAYCYTDSTLLCVDCLLSSKHKDHKIFSIEESFMKVKKKLNKKLNKFLEEKKEIISKGPSNLDKVFQIVSQNFDFAIRKIELEFHKIQNLIANKKQKILSVLDDKFQKSKQNYTLLLDKIKTKQKSIKELENIQKDLQEDFEKNQQLSFLITQKKIMNKLATYNKSIQKISDEIHKMEVTKFYDEKNLIEEKKIISDQIYKYNDKSLTPQKKKTQYSQNNFQNNCFSYFNKNPKSVNRSSKSKVRRGNKSKVNSNLSKLHKSFNKVAKISKNLKLKKICQEQYKDKTGDLKSTFELSVLNSEKMSFKNSCNTSQFQKSQNKSNNLFDNKVNIWLKNKPQGFLKANSLKINIKNELGRNPFQSNRNVFQNNSKNFSKKNSIQQQVFAIDNIYRQKNQSLNTQRQQKTPKKSKKKKTDQITTYYESIRRFSSEKKESQYKNKNQSLLYVLLGGQNENTVSLSICFYNPEIDQWLLSPSKQFIEMNKFYCSNMNQKSDQFYYLIKEKNIIIKNLYLKDLQDNSKQKQDYFFEYDYQVNSFAAFFDSNKFVYLAGGNNGKKILSNFIVINIQKKEILELPQMIEEREEFQILFDCQKQYIYALGGFNQNDLCLNSAEKYCLQNQKWQKINPMNCKRRGLQALCLNEGIFAIGGYDGEKYLSSVEFYDQQNDNWFLISFMNIGRCLFSCIPDQNQRGIYVFGGFNQKPLDSVEYMDLETNTWIIKKNIPYTVCMHSIISLKIQLITLQINTQLQYIILFKQIQTNLQFKFLCILFIFTTQIYLISIFSLLYCFLQQQFNVNIQFNDNIYLFFINIYIKCHQFYYILPNRLH